jgi:hypothetical protein
MRARSHPAPQPLRPGHASDELLAESGRMLSPATSKTEPLGYVYLSTLINRRTSGLTP